MYIMRIESYIDKYKNSNNVHVIEARILIYFDHFARINLVIIYCIVYNKCVRFYSIAITGSGFIIFKLIKSPFFALVIYLSTSASILTFSTETDGRHSTIGTLV